MPKQPESKVIRLPAQQVQQLESIRKHITDYYNAKDLPPHLRHTDDASLIGLAFFEFQRIIAGIQLENGNTKSTRSKPRRRNA